MTDLNRRRFPNRRAAWTFTINEAPAHKCHVTYARFPDTGDIGEVFIKGGKPGGDAEAMLRDCGLLISIALSYGVPMSAMYDALTKLDDGGPAGTASVVLKRLLELNSDSHERAVSTAPMEG